MDPLILAQMAVIRSSSISSANIRRRLLSSASKAPSNASPSTLPDLISSSPPNATSASTISSVKSYSRLSTPVSNGSPRSTPTLWAITSSSVVMTNVSSGTTSNYPIVPSRRCASTRKLFDLSPFILDSRSLLRRLTMGRFMFSMRRSIAIW